MMGFPVIPSKLCDFWSIQHESMEGDVLAITGTLPGGDSAAATFKKQLLPKGNWLASILAGCK